MTNYKNCGSIITRTEMHFVLLLLTTVVSQVFQEDISTKLMTMMMLTVRQIDPISNTVLMT